MKMTAREYCAIQVLAQLAHNRPANITSDDHIQTDVTLALRYAEMLYDTLDKDYRTTPDER